MSALNSSRYHGGLLRRPPLLWVRSAALEARRVHPDWTLRQIVTEGYNVAFQETNPDFHGVVIMPSDDVDD